MAIQIVDFPIKHGDFPLLCERSPEGNWVSQPRWFSPRAITIPVVKFPTWMHVIVVNPISPWANNRLIIIWYNIIYPLVNKHSYWKWPSRNSGFTQLDSMVVFPVRFLLTFTRPGSHSKPGDTYPMSWSLSIPRNATMRPCPSWPNAWSWSSATRRAAELKSCHGPAIPSMIYLKMMIFHS